MTLALVTGAGGFVGRNLVEALRSSGREVVAMVHSQRSACDLQGAGVQVLVADIMETDGYRQAAQQADEIYHLASVVAPKQASIAFDVNVGGTQRLARCIRESPSPGRLIYVSSLSASGPCVHDKPRRETDQDAPVSIYGKSKLAAEAELLKLADDLPISIVRPPGIFGPWDRNLLAMYQSIRWGINAIGISRQYRYSFVHVDDLTTGLMQVCEMGKRIKSGDDSDREGFYFISDPHPIPFETLGNMIAKSLDRDPPFHLTVPSTICSGVAFCSDMTSRLTGKRVYLNVDKMREARAGSWFCDVMRAEKEVHFRVAMDLEQRIVQTQQWYAQQGWL
ncbi:dTDP-4-dehydrorhamnose reductase [Rosistilla carotiformis]|uniref:dTDP-4-dehydrorhamnose reductase n=1 Tax=Rosistilla carotiformis TaxID=2528017 RepID=A0A518JYE3_9BACT|nr:NAD(P)-dependent oxidoreductase [Rosistilla carotiformis]QDV70561.1 dTDP-4-dehydrorhamnose reductase [Rosistilla carotiformis]